MYRHILSKSNVRLYGAGSLLVYRISKNGSLSMQVSYSVGNDGYYTSRRLVLRAYSRKDNFNNDPMTPEEIGRLIEDSVADGFTHTRLRS